MLSKKSISVYLSYRVDPGPLAQQTRIYKDEQLPTNASLQSAWENTCSGAVLVVLTIIDRSGFWMSEKLSTILLHTSDPVNTVVAEH